jgi:hypothetical protein
MAEEYFKLEGRTNVCVFRISLMDFLEDTTDGVSVAHFKLGEVLIFDTESFLEVGNALLSILEFLDLLIEPV